MIRAHETGLSLTVEQQREIFGDDWDPDVQRQAYERWGGTDQWKESAERAASRTPEQWAALRAELENLEGRLGEAVRAGVNPGSAEADALVDEHRAVFSNFFDLTVSMQVCRGGCTRRARGRTRTSRSTTRRSRRG
ncbi:MAG: TipAS antibiotic-recognition domain-containing protein [Corynebacterium variabile]|uniref:TipAS antibiotic-recognition domain-containing protein n=1 Tax=Corynebacterium variabile TaxID=1727 RepID=UPI003F910C28